VTDQAAEVRSAYERYEAALVSGDVATMNEMFLDDPHVVRFGVNDHQVGHAEIAGWRREHPGVPPGRSCIDTRVQVLTETVAVVTTRFVYEHLSVDGRQTQVWLATPGGWKVASAHVSEIPSF
jgi:ketosteroid isomerase-like protein